MFKAHDYQIEAHNAIISKLQQKTDGYKINGKHMIEICRFQRRNFSRNDVKYNGMLMVIELKINKDENPEMFVRYIPNTQWK